MKLGELAAAEQVRPPTMSRLIQDLESAKLVTRSSDKSDGRVVRIQATQRAKKLMKEGRSQRVTLLATWLDELSVKELQALNEAATSIEQLGNNRC
jgi:DNA-binding MarR family transcriptional regulator